MIEQVRLPEQRRRELLDGEEIGLGQVGHQLDDVEGGQARTAAFLDRPVEGADLGRHRAVAAQLGDGRLGIVAAERHDVQPLVAGKIIAQPALVECRVGDADQLEIAAPQHHAVVAGPARVPVRRRALAEGCVW